LCEKGLLAGPERHSRSNLQDYHFEDDRTTFTPEHMSRNYRTANWLPNSQRTKKHDGFKDCGLVDSNKLFSGKVFFQFNRGCQSWMKNYLTSSFLFLPKLCDDW